MHPPVVSTAASNPASSHLPDEHYSYLPQPRWDFKGLTSPGCGIVQGELVPNPGRDGVCRCWGGVSVSSGTRVMTMSLCWATGEDSGESWGQFWAPHDRKAPPLFLSQARGGGPILFPAAKRSKLLCARTAPAENLCRASETLPGAELCAEVWATSSQMLILSQLQLQTLSQIHPEDQHLALGHGSVSLDGIGLLGRENKFLRKGEAFSLSGVK